MLDSQKSTLFELTGTWNGDLGDSDHLWTYFFGAELSGGVPGAGEGMKKTNLLAMLRHGQRNMQQQNKLYIYFESRFEIWTSGWVDPAQNRAANPFK